jgi:hypothetical protein
MKRKINESENGESAWRNGNRRNESVNESENSEINRNNGIEKISNQHEISISIMKIVMKKNRSMKIIE